MGRVVVLAHRGYHIHGAKANSLEAIELGNKFADGVEIDVRCTKDGVLVLSHDAWTPSGKEIAEASFSNLKGDIDARIELPRLDDAVRALSAGKWLIVDLKVAGIAGDVMNTCSSRMREKLRVGSFDVAHLDGVPVNKRWAIIGSEPTQAIEGSGVGGIAVHAARFPIRAKAELELAAWGLQTRAEVHRLIRCGVEYFIIDDPSIMDS